MGKCHLSVKLMEGNREREDDGKRRSVRDEEEKINQMLFRKFYFESLSASGFVNKVLRHQTE